MKNQGQKHMVLNDFKLKILLRSLLFFIRVHCFFRQRKNKERVAAVLMLLPALIWLLPTFNFTLTLVQSFLFQAMIAYGLLSIWWIRKRHFRLAGINFFIYLLLLAKVNVPMQNNYSMKQGAAELSVLQFNIYASNKAYEETISEVLRLSPDFVSFQELTHSWAEALEAGLAEAYPYRKVVRHRDPTQGIAVFSKHPLAQVTELDWFGTANIAGQVLIDREAINFLCLHTRSPMTRSRWQVRNEHIAKAQELINEQPGEFLVLGDFNTVPWDSRLARFKSDTKLTDSRKKLTPTYPTWNPFIGQIPIDYIFHSEGIGCQSLDSVNITSDHKAILGTYHLKGA